MGVLRELENAKLRIKELEEQLCNANKIASELEDKVMSLQFDLRKAEKQRCFWFNKAIKPREVE